MDVNYPMYDIYENCIEPLWKNILANQLNDFINQYYETLTKSDIKNLNVFIEKFNSLYEIDSVYASFELCISKMISNVENLKLIKKNCMEKTELIMKSIQNSDNNHEITKTPFTSFDISRITNGQIYVLKDNIEKFSTHKIYLQGILQLLTNNTNISTTEINDTFYKGFSLTKEEYNIIATNINKNINLNTTMIEILINLEKIRNIISIYPILRSPYTIHGKTLI